MNPRYLIFLLPFFYAVLASAVLPILQKISEKRVIIIFVVLIICIWSQPLYTYYNNNQINGDWRSASVFVKNTAKANDIVIIMPDYNQIPFNFYYNNSTYGTIQFSTSSKDDIEKINSMRCNNNVSAFIVITPDIKTVYRSADLIPWLDMHTIAISNFNNVVVGAIKMNC